MIARAGSSDSHHRGARRRIDSTVGLFQGHAAPEGPSPIMPIPPMMIATLYSQTTRNSRPG
jgi:hypothetical protein